MLRTTLYLFLSYTPWGDRSYSCYERTWSQLNNYCSKIFTVQSNGGRTALLSRCRQTGKPLLPFRLKRDPCDVLVQLLYVLGRSYCSPPSLLACLLQLLASTTTTRIIFACFHNEKNPLRYNVTPFQIIGTLVSLLNIRRPRDLPSIKVPNAPPACVQFWCVGLVTETFAGAFASNCVYISSRRIPFCSQYRYTVWLPYSMYCSLHMWNFYFHFLIFLLDS